MESLVTSLRSIQPDNMSIALQPLVYLIDLTPVRIAHGFNEVRKKHAEPKCVYCIGFPRPVVQERTQLLDDRAVYDSEQADIDIELEEGYR